MPDTPSERLSPKQPARRRFWWRWWAVFLLLLQAYLWSGFLVQTQRVPAPTFDVVQYSFAIASGIAMVVWSFVTRRPIWVMGCWVIFTLSQMIVNFSYLYWSQGSASNFTMSLSHLDAIYFAIGTLTTSGTGNLAATSETTRGFQALQNVLDLSLVLFAVSLFVARFSVAVGRDRA
jgi:hypothetical protein